MRKKNLAFSVALLYSIFVFAQIPTDSLVGYWPFSGNANDESGNGNNGIIYGATLTSDRNGNVNNAYYFDGNSNYISIADSSILQIQDQISMLAWIKTDSLNPYDAIINKINPDAPSKGYGMCSYLENRLLGKIFWNHSEGEGAVVYSTKQITDNKWHFVGFTYDGYIAKLYLDNVIEDSIEYAGGIQKNTEPLLIGWDKNTYLGERFYQGVIDDIRIYNRAITEPEMKSLFYEGFCVQSITVTDTLIINANITAYNPITYINAIKVYPNPSKDYIYIDCGSNFETLDGYILRITNSLGQIVFETNVTQREFNVSLSSWTGKGLYFFYLINNLGNTLDIKKIVIQ